MEHRKIALYARTSLSVQTTGLEAQVRALETYCQVNGISSYEIYSDAGISGTKANRPQLDQLIGAVERGEVSSVILGCRYPRR